MLLVERAISAPAAGRRWRDGGGEKLHGGSGQVFAIRRKGCFCRNQPSRPMTVKSVVLPSFQDRVSWSCLCSVLILALRRMARGGSPNARKRRGASARRHQSRSGGRWPRSGGGLPGSTPAPRSSAAAVSTHGLTMTVQRSRTRQNRMTTMRSCLSDILYRPVDGLQQAQNETARTWHFRNLAARGYEDLVDPEAYHRKKAEEAEQVCNALETALRLLESRIVPDEAELETLRKTRERPNHVVGGILRRRARANC